MVNARAQANESPVLFCRTLECGYSPTMREFSADVTAPQSAMLCMDFSAKRAAPEPSERCAIMGFCKRTIFTRKTSGRLSSSEDRLILCYSFFKISCYLLRRKRCTMKGFYKCTLFYGVKPNTSNIFGRALMGFFSVQIFR